MLEGDLILDEAGGGAGYFSGDSQKLTFDLTQIIFYREYHMYHFSGS